MIQTRLSPRAMSGSVDLLELGLGSWSVLSPPDYQEQERDFCSDINDYRYILKKRA